MTGYSCSRRFADASLGQVRFIMNGQIKTENVIAAKAGVNNYRQAVQRADAPTQDRSVFSDSAPLARAA